MDFQARQYDPQIGRFLAVDPLADAAGQQVWSPYAAMGNAPESIIDPNGTQVKPSISYGATQNKMTIQALDAIGGSGWWTGFYDLPLPSLMDLGLWEGNWGAPKAAQNEYYYGAEAGMMWAWMTGQKYGNGRSATPGKAGAQRGFTKDQITDAGWIVDGETDQYYHAHTWVQDDKVGYRQQGGRFMKPEEQNEEYDWDKAKNVLDYTDGIFGMLEKNMRPNNSQWLGRNGRYNNVSWGGNQYTGARSAAFRTAARYKWAGRTATAATVIIGAVETYNGYQKDGGKFGYNANSAIAETTGSVVGGWVGAEAGATLGASIGVWFGGVGAVPGAIIGGFIGGLVGGNLGGDAGKGAVNLYYRK